jgi:hypothetical protein
MKTLRRRVRRRMLFGFSVLPGGAVFGSLTVKL